MGEGRVEVLFGDREEDGRYEAAIRDCTVSTYCIFEHGHRVCDVSLPDPIHHASSSSTS